MSEIALSIGQRRALLALSQTSFLSDRTNERLASGRKINSSIDAPYIYAKASSLQAKSNDLSNYNRELNLGIATLEGVQQSVTSIGSLLNQLQNTARSALTATSAQRAVLTSSFKSIGTQIYSLAKERFNNANLLDSSNASLSFKFSTREETTLNVKGVNLLHPNVLGNSHLFSVTAFSTQGSLIFSNIYTAGTGFSAAGASAVGIAITRVRNAYDRLQAHAQSLASVAQVIRIRYDFNTTHAAQLSSASNDLLAADISEESANAVALQTRFQLGVQAVSFAGRSNQNILRLFN